MELVIVVCIMAAAVDATLAHLIPDADRDEIDTWVEHVSRL